MKQPFLKTNSLQGSYLAGNSYILCQEINFTLSFFLYSSCNISHLHLGLWMPWAMRAKVCTPQGKEKQIVFKTLSVEISEVGELCVASFMGTTPWRGNLPILSPHLHTLPVVCVCVCVCVCVLLPLRWAVEGEGKERTASEISTM